MKLNIKNAFSNGRKITALISIICISLLSAGCSNEKNTNKSVTKDAPDTVEIGEDALLVTKNEITNNSEVSGDTLNSSNPKEGVEDLDAESLKTIATSNNTMKILISNVVVIDGNTITGIDENGEKLEVRLTGLEAPKLDEPLGKESAESLGRCVNGSENALLTVQTDNTTDKKGRTLASVEAAESDCNQHMIESGMAWYYEGTEDNLSFDDRNLYLDAHNYAQDNKMGVWAMYSSKP